AAGVGDASTSRSRADGRLDRRRWRALPCLGWRLLFPRLFSSQGRRAMQFIAPDILQEARELSPAVSGTALFIGLMLWLTGWSWHRFWVVLAATSGAGGVGRSFSPPLQIATLSAPLTL